MTDPSFSIVHDHAQRTVIITFDGQWTIATAEAYIAAVTADIRATPARLMPRHLLLDIRTCGLHVRGVTEALVEFRRNQIGEMERIAIVSASALDAMQARRITAARETAVFDAIEPARAWLAEADVQTG